QFRFLLLLKNFFDPTIFLLLPIRIRSYPVAQKSDAIPSSNAFLPDNFSPNPTSFAYNLNRLPEYKTDRFLHLWRVESFRLCRNQILPNKDVCAYQSTFSIIFCNNNFSVSKLFFGNKYSADSICLAVLNKNSL